ncbi:MAG: DcrB-related protein [Polyangiaceae bacterium]|nr:DcrB-related protein [Polyangiaceae bacterium]
MTPFYFNEAMVTLPGVAGMVDRSRQYLEIETVEGAKLELVIARAPLDADESLEAAVEKGIADQRRMLRAFTLLSKSEQTHAGMAGIEVHLRFIDPDVGPIYHYEFHSVVGDDRIGFHGICAVSHMEACDTWMRSVLESVRLRDA